MVAAASWVPADGRPDDPVQLTVFLRQPSGVAIRERTTLADAARTIGRVEREASIIVVENEKGHDLIIPVDNVASLEVQYL